MRKLISKLLSQTYIDLLLTTGTFFLVNALNYLFNVYGARNFTTEAFGYFTTVLGLSYLLTIPSNAIQNYVTKMIGENPGADQVTFARSLALKILYIGAGAGIVIALLSSLLSKLIDLPDTLIVVLALLTFSSGVFPVVRGFLFGLRRIYLVNITIILEVLLKGGFLLASQIDPSNPVIPLVGYALPVIMINLPLLFLFHKLVISNGTTPLENRIWTLANTVGTLILLHVPFTIDLSLAPNELRSDYSAIVLLGKIIFFGAISIAPLMFSKLSAPHSDRKRIFVTHTLFASAIGLGALLTLTVPRELILSVVLDNRYPAIESVYPLFLLAIFIYTIAYYVVHYLISLESRRVGWILLIIVLIQSVLFMLNRDSLDDLVRNQLVVYSLMLLFTTVDIPITNKAHSVA